MRALCVSSLVVLLAAGGVSAQYSVEADLNGVVGDPQPDYIVTAMGDSVWVDIWFSGLGDCPGCVMFHAYLCNPDHALTYQGTSWYPPQSVDWAYVAVPPDSAGCAMLYGFAPCFGWMIFPHKVARVTYRASLDASIAELLLGEGSDLLDLCYDFQVFSNVGEVLARIQIGDVTATEPTSWGSVKSLFR